MAKLTISEQIDRIVEAVLLPPHRIPSRLGEVIRPLASVAAGLRGLPRRDFRNRLKAELERRTMMASKPAVLAETRQTATAYLCVRDAAAAIEFYKKAFGATEVMRLVGPGTRVGHAEILIGNSLIFLSDEFPEYSMLSPQSLGGSSTKLKLDVENVDSQAVLALEAGATLVRPVEDQFYGERAGQFADPFGYTWILSSPREVVTPVEMQRRFDDIMQKVAPEAPESPTEKVSAFIREGFHTVTPYLVASDGAALIDFVKGTFGAEETFRDIGSAGGFHCELRLGDSMLMVGGGIPGQEFRGQPRANALHVYVEDTDAAYRKALHFGGTSISAPQDHEYGERGASVKDAFGNYWYIATHRGPSYLPKGLHDVNAYLHPLRAEPAIDFLKRAFGAEEVAKYASPDGVIHHAQVRVGTSMVEMGEAHGPYQPMHTMFYLYLPDSDAFYRRALAAGAASLYEPADMPYGDRVGGVRDAFGNEWCIATRIGRTRS